MNELELLSRFGKVEPMDRALIDATVEAIVHCPDRTAGPRHRGPGRRRRRVSRLVVLSASVAAGLAAAGLVVSGAGGSSSPRPAPQMAQPGGGVLTAYVVNHSLAALETARGYVERVVRNDGSGIPISWIGPNQLLDEVPGQSATLWTWAAPGVDTVLRIDYLHHTWSKSVIPVPAPRPGPIGRAPSPAAVVEPPKALTGAEPSATSIAALFRQPGTEVVRTATLDGTLTYELLVPSLDANGKPITAKAITAWVDARTYLPVRIAEDVPVNQPAWTEDFTWEPATPQALAVFDLEPPALFHQTADPGLQPRPPGH